MGLRGEALSRHWPLLVEGTRLYASRGLELFASSDGGRAFERVASVRASRARRLAARIPLAARVGRLGFQALRRLPGGALVGVVRGRIVRSEAGADVLETVFRVPRGSRPLGLCVDGSGRVFFGEYFANPDREEVHVFGSDEGLRWSPAFTFPAGRIRHVHGLVHDSHRDGLWVLTGDENGESGLWFTGDGFRHLDPVAEGGQRTRAMAAVPLPDGLLVPTDSPRIRNRVQLLDPDTGALEEVARLPGSAFHAVASGGLLLVSTVAEPSDVNTTREATLFASADGTDWRCVDRWTPDVLARRLAGAARLLRYPELALAPGENRTGYVFAGGRAVAGGDGRLLRWPLDGLRAALDGRPAEAPA